MKKVSFEKILCVINSLENIKITNEQLNASLPDLGMDSITFIQVIVGLEEMFDCEIPDSKLIISEMDTARKIYDLLQELYKTQL